MLNDYCLGYIFYFIKEILDRSNLSDKFIFRYCLEDVVYLKDWLVW